MARRIAPPIDNFFHNDDDVVDLFSTLIGSYVELLEESGSDSSSVCGWLSEVERWRNLRVAIEREREWLDFD